jgi:xylan 1,4-beta-xylosidase
MNIDGVRKPAWFVYKYLRALRGNEVPTADADTFAASDGRHIEALVWDWVQPKQDVSDRPYYTKLHPAAAAAPATLRFSNLRPGSYRLQVRRTGFHCNDPQSAWIEMGKPATPSAAQVAKLQSLTRDLPQRNAVVQVSARGAYSLTLPMRTEDVVLVTMERMQR